MQLAGAPTAPRAAPRHPHADRLVRAHRRADAPRASCRAAGSSSSSRSGRGWTIDGRTYTSFAAGLHDAPAHTEHDGLGHGIQAYLTPLGARRFFGMPMGELTAPGRRARGPDRAGGRRAGRAARRGARTGRTRIDLFERAIASACCDAPPVASELEWAWERLLESRRRGADRRARRRARLEPPPLRRRASATSSGCRRRRSRGSLRFERAVERLRAGDDLADLALDSGYYDQAHFNRDFRAFAGATPTAYRRAPAVSASVPAPAVRPAGRPAAAGERRQGRFTPPHGEAIRWSSRTACRPPHGLIASCLHRRGAPGTPPTHSTRRPSGPLVSTRSTPAFTRTRCSGSSGSRRSPATTAPRAAQRDVQLLLAGVGLVVRTRSCSRAAGP